MKTISILIFTLVSNILIAQSSNSIQIIVQPFVQKIGNLNKQYTNIADSRIFVDYVKMPGQEFGLEFKHKCKGKWGWGVGATNFSQKQAVYFSSPEGEEAFRLGNYCITMTQNISFRLSSTYQINSKLQTSFLLSSSFTYLFSSNFTKPQEVGFIIPSVALTGTIESRKPYNQYLIPEINLSYNLCKNLNIQTGLKFKFWDTHKESGIINLKATYYDDNTLLHESHIKNTIYSYYMGLTYTISFKRKQH